MRHTTVLVIAHQWSLQELARIILHTAGYRVLLADDGISGIQQARAARPEVIILDQSLPDMEGVQVLREIRRTAKTGRIPVVLVAADTSETALTAAVRAGVSGIVRRPFHPTELLTATERVITHRRRHDQSLLPMAV